MHSQCSSAVDIKGAEKRYGKTSKSSKPTFTRLNLNLPRGNIYGLLGPSGCGKTTLLRCILGRLKLDKGSVMVFGHCPGTKESGIPGATVGYEAQNTTVYLTMTIGEYLRYFGFIFGMSSGQIQSKTEYFIDLLRLPSKDTLTTNLSGGHKRCVQFAAACMHGPKLLILDEPTVGIDVITKQRMWDHLVRLTRNNDTSVILTTHYIEEARLADRVGMLHGRTMAAEDTTANLLTKYDETTLEAVFLKICYQKSFDSQISKVKPLRGKQSQQLKSVNNESRLSGLESGEGDYVLDKPRTVLSSKMCGFNMSFQRLYAIVMRTFINIYRFPGLLLLLVLLPSLQVLLFGYSMSNSISGVQIAVVNNDVGEMGAQYLSYLNPDTIIQKFYIDYDAGIEAVRRGEMYGMLYIKSNFSDVILKRFTDFALIKDETVKAGTIVIHMDNTNINIAKFAEFHLLEMFQHFVYDALDLAGYNPAAGRPQIDLSAKTVRILTQPNRIYLLSGQIMMAIFHAALPVAIFNIFIERQKGYMEPNLIAGVTPVEIVLGLFLGQLVILFFQVAGVILSSPALLSSANKGSIFLIFSLLYVQGICGTSAGVLLSLIWDEVTTLFQITSYVIFLGASFTGVYWPFESLPVYFRYFGQLLPMTLPTRAMAFIIHRGWNLYHFSILSAFGVLLIWTVIFLAFAFLFFYLKE